MIYRTEGLIYAIIILGSNIITLTFLNMAKDENEKPEIEFYDLKSKKKFKSTSWRIVEKSGRNFAVTKSLTGDYECWRVLGKDQAAELKKAA